MIRSAVLIKYTRVTDGQTDGIGVAYTHYSIYAVARKKASINICYSAPSRQCHLRYMARTKQRRTYLPYTFPAIAGTHLLTPKVRRVK